MRIKCPNSDVFLDLPDDRTDMKFRCPSCKKMHRVTVSITSPGDAAAAAKAASKTRSIPKKYATGAYPPVVDIPIDANFVLFDETTDRHDGIDLGQQELPPEPSEPHQAPSKIPAAGEPTEKAPPTPETKDAAASAIDEPPAPESVARIEEPPAAAIPPIPETAEAGDSETSEKLADEPMALDSATPPETVPEPSASETAEADENETGEKQADEPMALDSATSPEIISPPSVSETSEASESATDDTLAAELMALVPPPLPPAPPASDTAEAIENAIDEKPIANSGAQSSDAPEAGMSSVLEANAAKEEEGNQSSAADAVPPAPDEPAKDAPSVSEVGETKAEGTGEQPVFSPIALAEKASIPAARPASEIKEKAADEADEQPAFAPIPLAERTSISVARSASDIKEKAADGTGEQSAFAPIPLADKPSTYTKRPAAETEGTTADAIGSQPVFTPIPLAVPAPRGSASPSPIVGEAEADAADEKPTPPPIPLAATGPVKSPSPPLEEDEPETGQAETPPAADKPATPFESADDTYLDYLPEQPSSPEEKRQNDEPESTGSDPIGLAGEDNRTEVSTDAAAGYIQPQSADQEESTVGTFVDIVTDQSPADMPLASGADSIASALESQAARSGFVDSGTPAGAPPSEPVAPEPGEKDIPGQPVKTPEPAIDAAASASAGQPDETAPSMNDGLVADRALEAAPPSPAPAASIYFGAAPDFEPQPAEPINDNGMGQPADNEESTVGTFVDIVTEPPQPDEQPVDEAKAAVPPPPETEMAPVHAAAPIYFNAPPVADPNPLESEEERIQGQPANNEESTVGTFVDIVTEPARSDGSPEPADNGEAAIAAQPVTEPTTPPPAMGKSGIFDIPASEAILDTPIMESAGPAALDADDDDDSSDTPAAADESSVWSKAIKASEAAKANQAGKQATETMKARDWDKPAEAGTRSAPAAPASKKSSTEQIPAAKAAIRSSARISAPRTGPARPMASRRRPGRMGGMIKTLLTLAVLAGIGYMAWQQYLNMQADANVDSSLTQARLAHSGGDFRGAARLAGEAVAAFDESKKLHSFTNLWEMAQSRFGGQQTANPVGQVARQYRGDLEKIDGFTSGLDAIDATQIPPRLREALASGTDAGMGKAMISEAYKDLERRARDLAASEELRPEREAARIEDLKGVAEAMPADASGNGVAGLVAQAMTNQANRLAGEAKKDLATALSFVDTDNARAFRLMSALAKRMSAAPAPLLQRMSPRYRSPADLAVPADRPAVEQLAALSALMEQAEHAAQTSLGDPDFDSEIFYNLSIEAQKLGTPNAALSLEANRLILAERNEADNLSRLRSDILSKVQADARSGSTRPGVRMAWSLLRMGTGDAALRLDSSSLKYDDNNAEMAFTLEGVEMRASLGPNDYEKRIRTSALGFNFTTGWSPLFRKHVSWMAEIAAAMRDAWVDPSVYPDWTVMEGPGGLIAISSGRAGASSGGAMASVPAGKGGRAVFFRGALRPLEELPPPEGAKGMLDNFLAAAKALHNGVMSDISIPQQLRQALNPVLMGTYEPVDPRDYFDSSFCRRLVEADYLETFIKPFPPALAEELRVYREALGKIEAGYDEFSVDLGGGTTLFGVVQFAEISLGDGQASDQDEDSGETKQRYTWRMEKPDASVFFSPLPARSIYALSLAEEYPGRHKIPPQGIKPTNVGVWHAKLGLLASYKPGAAKAEGNAARWDEAIRLDRLSWVDSTVGPPGWNFPLHVLERDDQGDPVSLATLNGVVQSPNFTGIADDERRRAAEDEWLESTAATLSTPGELGLIFHQFFRYCSDSPLPEMPNLIGSHFGLSDTHQTVYESLERRWVGRLIGDCDDLAEFFQVLTRKQGKLSHVMQLPGHAACGYVDKYQGKFRFVVLQTGPVLQFIEPTLNDAVESAYNYFDREGGEAHFTVDAVPLLLRFAGEQTRTPFVLSARIYADADYAEKMIQVQGYWHENTYSAAIDAMERMLRTDREIGNVKELGSLYERVGWYEKSAELRREELEAVKNNPQARLSCLLEIAQLHFQDKDRAKALEALNEMQDQMREFVRRDNSPDFFRAMAFRSAWAMLLSRLGEPARSWELLRFDVEATKRQFGRVSDPVIRTLVIVYDRIRLKQDAGGTLTPTEEKVKEAIEKELDTAFSRGFFKPDDHYNMSIGRYFMLGKFAVAKVGREAGLARLKQDGPYPTSPKDHTRRTEAITEEDWEWFRISPQLYLSYGLEMLDKDEYPEFYSPEAAKPMLEDVARAVVKGTGLGSDVAGEDDQVRSAMALAFINKDLNAFRAVLSAVSSKDYSSLYDEAALTFGMYCGLIPLSDFRAWIDVFHEHFPGKQHYFKVVYRAIDKEHYDHALMMAEATAAFFPQEKLLVKEAEFIRGLIPELKQKSAERGQARTNAAAANGAEEESPAGTVTEEIKTAA